MASGSSSTKNRAGSLRRYGSDFNLNTPNRYMMTPLRNSPVSLRRNTMIGGDHMRKMLHENCIKILEVLQRDEEFYSRLNLQSGGLRSMTAKQFMQISTYFISFIASKNITTNRDFQADPLSAIIQFLKQINCPYMVNKSMLRTPNAPHTFDQIVPLLLWLSDFVAFQNVKSDYWLETDDTLSNDVFLRDREFPDAEFTAAFSRELMNRGFQMWNNQSDELLDLQNLLVNSFISAKLKGIIKSVDELNTLIVNVKDKSDKLKKIPCIVKNVCKFETLESQYMNCEELEYNLGQRVSRKQDELASIELNWKDKHGKVQMKEKQIEKVQQQISLQKSNVGEFKELLSRSSSLKMSLNTLNKELETLKNEDSVNQIQLARLLSNKSNAIFKFNNHIMKIYQLLCKSKIEKNIPVNSLCIDANSTLNFIKDVHKRLHKIDSMVKNRINEINSSIAHATMQLDVMRPEEEKLHNEAIALETEFKKCCCEFKRVSLIVQNNIEKENTKTNAIEKTLEEKQISNLALKKAITEAQNQVKRLERSNEELLAKGEQKAMELIEMKQQLINELDEAIDLVDELSAVGQVQTNKNKVNMAGEILDDHNFQ